MKKEELIIENTNLKTELQKLKDNDEKVRETLSDLLDSYEYKTNFYARDEKTLVVQSWIGIGFLIGELKADANYSNAIEAREELKREVSFLREELEKLKNPILLN
jgi:hypothetical protein